MLFGICIQMSQNGYLQLLETRNQLCSPLFDGVNAAKVRLHLVNQEISNIEKNPFIFEPLFIHKKPGYTLKMINSLAYQASKGYDLPARELQNYSNWLIHQMSFSR